MKHFIRTPVNISGAVKRLSRTLNASAEPEFYVITPEPGAKPLDCFHCVRDKVAREGGRICFGWVIWEWPRVFIEAEHHAVYEPPTGPPCVDITPSTNPEIRRRLFVIDESATYDFENEGIRRDNVRVAIADDPAVEFYFRLAKLKTELWNRVPGVNVPADAETAMRLMAIETEAAKLVAHFAMHYTGQNEACFCGSREKFKRCHGRS